MTGAGRNPDERQDVVASAVPTQRDRPSALPRPRVRLRTRPLPAQMNVGSEVETWEAPCEGCGFTATAGTRPALLHLVRQHMLTAAHPAPPICASFVIPHGTRVRDVASRLTLHIMVRTR